MKKLMSCIFLLMALIGIAQAGPPVLVATAGDSFTLQTGDCTGASWYTTMDSCLRRGDYPADKAYGSYINYASYIGNTLGANLGIGGDTCDSYSPAPDVDPKSLLANINSKVIATASLKQIKIVSVLIGGNDLLGHPEATTANILSCLSQVWSTLQSAGFKVVAMTYPPIHDGWLCTPHFSTYINSSGETVCGNTQRMRDFNVALRDEVTFYNSVHTTKVTLVDAENAYTSSNSDLTLNTLSAVNGAYDSHPNAHGAKKIAGIWVSTPQVFQ